MTALIFSLALVGIIAGAVNGCTTIVVGCDATQDGSAITTSSGDDRTGDFRLAKVPARRWPDGSRRPVYSYNDKYPHVVQFNRSTTWEPSNLDISLPQTWGQTEPIGSIPQVRQTYALFETGLGYGLMNEFQVVMGESTCSARFVSVPVHKGGRALLDVSELTKIALERSKSAREAIMVMGSLAEKYGYYGAEWEGEMKFDEAGEAIPVADQSEAWIFHVLPDDTGKSAIWCAQKVPSNHASAVANMFVIKEVDPKSENFIFSPNMYDIAKRNKLWTPSDGKLHFTRVFAGPLWRPAYSTRRVWRIFSLIAPSIKLSPYSNEFGDEYPFSVPVDKKLSLQDIFVLHRDHYEGSDFDLTKGLQAGPFGDPDRYDSGPALNVTAEEAKTGFFERSIGLFRTSYTYVAQSRGWMPRYLGPLIWFAPHSSPTSVFVPLHLSINQVPAPLQTGSLYAVDSDSLFWRACLVSNWAHRYYRLAIEDVQRVQRSLEIGYIEKVQKHETGLLLAHNFSVLSPKLAEAIPKLLEIEAQVWTQLACEEYIRLFARLVAKYRDGFVLEDPAASKLEVRSMFYPRYWLEAVGFWDTDEFGRAKASLEGFTKKSIRVERAPSPPVQSRLGRDILLICVGVMTGGMGLLSWQAVVGANLQSRLQYKSV